MWPRFADQMIAALSSMFRQAVKRGKMPFNPCPAHYTPHVESEVSIVTAFNRLKDGA